MSNDIITQSLDTRHCENCGKDYPSDEVDTISMGGGDDDRASICKICQSEWLMYTP